MKNIILVFFSLLVGFRSIGQETIDVEDIKVYSFVQTKAQPKEGLQHFYKNYTRKFNSAKFSSPTGALDVRLKFIVEKDGTFSDVQVVNENVQGLGEEAIRVLMTMPAWNPATHDGKIVRSAFKLPMRIRVNKDDEKTEETQEKSLNEVEEKNETISETYLESLNNFLVTNNQFEFKCNCIFVKNNNKEYHYESQDELIYYQISIEKKDEKEVEKTIEEVKKNVIYQGGLANEIKLSGIKATEISLSSKGVGLFSNSKMIVSYKEGYLIGIIISSEDSQIADAVTEHFKQTFKLKL